MSKFCIYCGAKIEAEDKFCFSCGRKLSKSEVEVSKIAEETTDKPVAATVVPLAEKAYLAAEPAAPLVAARIIPQEDAQSQPMASENEKTVAPAPPEEKCAVKETPSVPKKSATAEPVPRPRKKKAPILLALLLLVAIAVGGYYWHSTKEPTGDIPSVLEPDPAPEPDSAPSPEPDPAPAPDSAPSLEPDPTPEPDPVPAPDPAPEPEPEPDPDPVPVPDPAPETYHYFRYYAEYVIDEYNSGSISAPDKSYILNEIAQKGGTLVGEIQCLELTLNEDRGRDFQHEDGHYYYYSGDDWYGQFAP